MTDLLTAAGYIEGIPKFAGKSGPDTVRKYLDLMGAPDRYMRIVHVAGTNGKGSVCSYMESICRQAGLSTGLFISPHLVDIRERICINGSMAAEEEFCAAFDAVMDLVKDQVDTLAHPGYFDLLFLMAMHIFSVHKPDIVILETGVGGRLDATNTVYDKELCVITRIGLDHMQYLGDTVSMIAAEKAAICRQGKPAVFLDEPSEAFNVIYEAAVSAGAIPVPVHTPAADEYRIEDGILSMSADAGALGQADICTHTFAAYQRENAALAVRAAALLPEVTMEALQRGMRMAHWSCRMDEVLPGVFVDGAHNPDGMKAFLESAGQIRPSGNGKRLLIFGMMRDKDYKEAAGLIIDAGIFDTIALVRLDSKRSLDKEELVSLFGKACAELKVFDSAKEAFDDMLEQKSRQDILFCAGSLYLAGDILSCSRLPMVNKDV